MVKYFQARNPRTKSWIKFKIMPNGRARICSVKKTPFANIKKR